MKVAILFVGAVAATKASLNAGVKQSFLQRSLNQVRVSTGEKAKTKSVPSDFFQKPAEYEIIQQNSAVGEFDPSEGGKNPQDPHWFENVDLPNKGVTGDYGVPVLVEALDQLPLDLFNTTVTEFTALGFPVEELNQGHDFSHDGEPMHPHVVTTNDTVVTLDELGNMTSNDAQEIVASPEHIHVVNDTSSNSTDVSVLIETSADELGEAVGSAMDEASSLVSSAEQEFEALFQMHQVDVGGSL